MAENKNVLIFGEYDEESKTIKLSGEENNNIKIILLDESFIYEKILKELKIFNVYLEMINQSNLKDKEIKI